MWNRIYIALILACTMCACSARQHIFPFSLWEGWSEARHTLDAADSLRVNEGRLYDDSLALAEAYTLLGHWRLIYPDDYARACYSSVYLLRQHNNQVAAMQAFIAGSHAPYVSRVVRLPWFSNYHILGRIYSNMGTMSHLADEFELGYDMYKMSAEFFRKAGDTTLYYYQHNAMALELAEQKLHDETLSLLGKIETECADANVLTKTWETKAILYKNLAQYDSAIYAAGQLYSNGYSAASGYVTMAQSYEHLGQLDSALFYAQRVLAMPNASDKERYNMLYFFVYHDSSAGEEEKMRRYEERADIDNKNIDPVQEQLVLSTELIRQDRNKKPDYSLVIIICCIFLLFSVALIVRRRHKSHILRIKKEEQTLSTQKQELSVKEQELSSKAQELSAKRQVLLQEQASHQEALLKDLESTCERLRNRSILSTRKGMNNYASAKKSVNLRFNMLADKLEATHVLSEREILFCVLVLLDVSQLKIAQILTYSPNSIKKTKDIIAKKLGVTSLSLRNYLIDKVFQ